MGDISVILTPWRFSIGIWENRFKISTPRLRKNCRLLTHWTSVMSLMIHNHKNMVTPKTPFPILTSCKCVWYCWGCPNTTSSECSETSICHTHILIIVEIIWGHIWSIFTRWRQNHFLHTHTLDISGRSVWKCNQSVLPGNNPFTHVLDARDKRNRIFNHRLSRMKKFNFGYTHVLVIRLTG